MTEKQIRESLLGQLEKKGAKIDSFIDLVEDYVRFYKIKNKLAADITKRGITYRDVSSTGIMMTKNNPSVKELVMVNKSMMTILQQLDISTRNVITDEDDSL